MDTIGVTIKENGETAYINVDIDDNADPIAVRYHNMTPGINYLAEICIPKWLQAVVIESYYDTIMRRYKEWLADEPERIACGKAGV